MQDRSAYIASMIVDILKEVDELKNTDENLADNIIKVGRSVIAIGDYLKGIETKEARRIAREVLVALVP